jgi:hypothetical protein
MNLALSASPSHPLPDRTYTHYIETEYVEARGTSFSEPVVMPGYRRPLSEAIAPVLETGFALDKLVEPRPTEAYRQADLEGCKKLMRRCRFLCIRARK